MNRHTATDANGTVHTRNSENRVYTHCVAVRFSYEAALKSAQKTYKGDASNYAHYKAYIDGTSEFLVKPSYCTDEHHAVECARAIANAKANIGDAKSLEEYTANNVAKAVAAVEKSKASGYYDAWQVIGWNSRRDLAEKEAARQRARDSVAEVQILEAVLK